MSRISNNVLYLDPEDFSSRDYFYPETMNRIMEYTYQMHILGIPYGELRIVVPFSHRGTIFSVYGIPVEEAVPDVMK